jgi:hypothetical protein
MAAGRKKIQSATYSHSIRVWECFTVFMHAIIWRLCRRSNELVATGSELPLRRLVMYVKGYIKG